MSKVELLGFELKDEANLETLIQDALQTSEIEGAILNHELVRFSIATRLGLEYSGLEHSDRHKQTEEKLLFHFREDSKR